MSDVAEDCTHCNSKGTLVKQVTKVARVIKRNSSALNKPGHLVKQYIKDVKQEVKQEKRRLQSQEYKE